MPERGGHPSPLATNPLRAPGIGSPPALGQVWSKPKTKNRKANKIVRITVSYGISNTLSKDMPEGTTMGQVLQDKNLQSVLGFGANVVGKVDGQTQDSNYRLKNGDEVDIEVKANTKAKRMVKGAKARKAAVSRRACRSARRR